MAENFMAYPELRHPFEETPIHPDGCKTVLYMGNTITLSTTGSGDGLLINPADLRRINGFELKPQGACYEDICIPLTDGLPEPRFQCPEAVALRLVSREVPHLIVQKGGKNPKFINCPIPE